MNRFAQDLINSPTLLKEYRRNIDMVENNYNTALELLGDYKYELQKQINEKSAQRKEFIDNIPYQAEEQEILEYDMELTRLKDSLYKLDIFLSNFA